MRPVSIVSTQHFVNLARKKALQFGKTELVGPEPCEDGIDGPDSFRQDLVVTSTASETEVKHTGQSGRRGISAKITDAFAQKPRGLFADQFEVRARGGFRSQVERLADLVKCYVLLQNLANFEAHYLGTGPELVRQTNGEIDVFVAGAGTGGTLAGTATCLKEGNKGIRVILADPQGSGLYHKVKNGVLYASTEAEGRRRRYQVDTVVEGIGINRITANLQKGLHLIDDAVKVTDLEAVIMSRHLVQHDGLFLGSSSAVNLVAACRIAKQYQPWDGKKTIVTILCDSGSRHYSKFW